MSATIGPASIGLKPRGSLTGTSMPPGCGEEDRASPRTARGTRIRARFRSALGPGRMLAASSATRETPREARSRTVSIGGRVTRVDLDRPGRRPFEHEIDAEEADFRPNAEARAVADPPQPSSRRSARLTGGRPDDSLGRRLASPSLDRTRGPAGLIAEQPRRAGRRRGRRSPSAVRRRPSACRCSQPAGIVRPDPIVQMADSPAARPTAFGFKQPAAGGSAGRSPGSRGSRRVWDSGMREARRDHRSRVARRRARRHRRSRARVRRSTAIRAIDAIGVVLDRPGVDPGRIGESRWRSPRRAGRDSPRRADRSGATGTRPGRGRGRRRGRATVGANPARQAEPTRRRPGPTGAEDEQGGAAMARVDPFEASKSTVEAGPFDRSESCPWAGRSSPYSAFLIFESRSSDLLAVLLRLDGPDDDLTLAGVSCLGRAEAASSLW